MGLVRCKARTVPCRRPCCQLQRRQMPIGPDAEDGGFDPAWVGLDPGDQILNRGNAGIRSCHGQILGHKDAGEIGELVEFVGDLLVDRRQGREVGIDNEQRMPVRVALATTSVPIMVAAPGLLSTKNVWFIRFCRNSARLRASRSVVPPGLNGTTILIGWLPGTAAQARDLPGQVR
jgi:hypothetical protein